MAKSREFSFEKKKNQNSRSVSPLASPLISNLQKVSFQLSLGKKLMLIAFLDQYKFTSFQNIKVFPRVLPIFMNLWFFLKIPKIQKSYNIHAIFLRVVWWSKRWKWSLKSQKTRFFQAFFSTGKRLGKNVFFASLRTTSIFLIIKILSKILHGYYTTFVFLEFWKKTHKFVKIGKTSGNTLVFWDPKRIPWLLKKHDTVR